MGEDDSSEVLNRVLSSISTTRGTYRRDGERSNRRGPCKCGYKHWLKNKERDFVFEVPVGGGNVILLGYDVLENPYTVAQSFISENNLNKSSLTDTHLVSQIANLIMENTISNRGNDDSVPESDDKKDDFDVYKRKWATNSGHAVFDKQQNKWTTSINMFEEKARKRESRLKEISKKKKEELEEKKRIKMQLAADRLEKQASLAIEPQHSHPHPPPPPSSSISSPQPRMMSLADMRKEAEGQQGPDHHQQSVGSLPSIPQEYKDWVVDDLVDVLECYGEEKLRSSLAASGFGPEKAELFTLYALAKVQESSMKGEHSLEQESFVAFQGQGHSLMNQDSSMTLDILAESPETFNIETNPPIFQVDEDKPQTSIQIRLFDGTSIIQHFNLSHTIADVRAFLDQNYSSPSGTMYDLISPYPRKVFLDLGASIEQSGLSNSSIVQAPRK